MLIEVQTISFAASKSNGVVLNIFIKALIQRDFVARKLILHYISSPLHYILIVNVVYCKLVIVSL